MLILSERGSLQIFSCISAIVGPSNGLDVGKQWCLKVSQGMDQNDIDINLFAFQS